MRATGFTEKAAQWAHVIIVAALHLHVLLLLVKHIVNTKPGHIALDS